MDISRTHRPQAWADLVAEHPVLWADVLDKCRANPTLVQMVADINTWQGGSVVTTQLDPLSFTKNAVPGSEWIWCRWLTDQLAHQKHTHPKYNLWWTKLARTVDEGLWASVGHDGSFDMNKWGSTLNTLLAGHDIKAVEPVAREITPGAIVGWHAWRVGTDNAVGVDVPTSAQWAWWADLAHICAQSSVNTTAQSAADFVAALVQRDVLDEPARAVVLRLCGDHPGVFMRAVDALGQIHTNLAQDVCDFWPTAQHIRAAINTRLDDPTFDTIALVDHWVQHAGVSVRVALARDMIADSFSGARTAQRVVAGEAFGSILGHVVQQVPAAQRHLICESIALSQNHVLFMTRLQSDQEGFPDQPGVRALVEAFSDGPEEMRGMVTALWRVMGLDDPYDRIPRSCVDVDPNNSTPELVAARETIMLEAKLDTAAGWARSAPRMM